MAGTLFQTGSLTKHFDSFVRSVSNFIPVIHSCGFHFRKKWLSFPSVKGNQDLHQSWCKVASNDVGALYLRHFSSYVTYSSSTPVVNLHVPSRVFWRKPTNVSPGILQRCPSSYNQIRPKSKSRQQDTDDASDDSDEDDALENDDFEAPANFKVMKINVASTRVDSVASHALDVSRNNLEEIFLGAGIYLNGEKLLKKSTKMDTGDYVDLVMEKTDDQLKVKRMKLLKIYPEKTNKEKVILKVRVWKAPFFIAKPTSEPRYS